MPKLTSLRTAFIRVSAENNTKNGLVSYKLEDLKQLLEQWSESVELQYFLIEHTEEENRHFHIVIKFPYPYVRESLLKKFPYGKLEKPKSVKACVRYLIHLDHPEKKQYQWEDVITNCEDLSPYQVANFATQQEQLHKVVNKIKNGEIREYNYPECIDCHLYSKYKGIIRNAFEHFKDKKTMDKNRNIQVLFYTGPSGTGKTSSAKKYAEQKNKSYCVSSSSNDPLQDYKGEEVLILDDLRDSDFSFSDLLKILDNHTSSSCKSRFVNKPFLGNTIIITSVQDLQNWYNEDLESKIQLKRRVATLVRFTKKLLITYTYDESSDDYEEVFRIENNVVKEFNKKKSENLDPESCPIPLSPDEQEEYKKQLELKKQALIKEEEEIEKHIQDYYISIDKREVIKKELETI